MRGRLACVAFILVLAAALPAAAAPDGSRVRVQGASIVPASGWEHMTEGFPEGMPKGVVLILLAPVEGSFRANVNVMRETTGMSDGEYLQRTLSELEKSGGAKIQSQLSMKVGGHKALRLVWTVSANNMDLQYNTTIVLVDGTAWLVTGTSLAENYPKYSAAFESMANSLQVGK